MGRASRRRESRRLSTEMQKAVDFAHELAPIRQLAVSFFDDDFVTLQKEYHTLSSSTDVSVCEFDTYCQSIILKSLTRLGLDISWRYPSFRFEIIFINACEDSDFYGLKHIDDTLLKFLDIPIIPVKIPENTFGEVICINTSTGENITEDIFIEEDFVTVYEYGSVEVDTEALVFIPFEVCREWKVPHLEQSCKTSKRVQ